MGLSGCSSSAFEGALTRYLSGLARTFEINANRPTLAVVRAPKAPDPQNQASSSLNLLEFLNTAPCELHQVISAQNGTLGKLGNPTTAMIYEIEFLQKAPACIQQLSRAHPDLAAQLAAVAQHKQADLPDRLRTTLLRSPEWLAFWQPRLHMGDYPAAHQSDLETAFLALLEQIDDMQSLAYSGGTKSLNEALIPLRSGEGGLLLVGWSELLEMLLAGNALITSFLDKRPLCYNGRVNPRAQQFQSIVLEVFVKQLQPLIARLNQRTYVLWPLIDRFESTLEADADPNYATFVKERDTRVTLARRALKDHVALINELFTQCNLQQGAG